MKKDLRLAVILFGLTLLAYVGAAVLVIAVSHVFVVSIVLLLWVALAFWVYRRLAPEHPRVERRALAIAFPFLTPVALGLGLLTAVIPVALADALGFGNALADIVATVAVFLGPPISNVIMCMGVLRLTRYTEQTLKRDLDEDES